jgi:hypothetical protein
VAPVVVSTAVDVGAAGTAFDSYARSAPSAWVDEMSDAAHLEGLAVALALELSELAPAG